MYDDEFSTSGLRMIQTSWKLSKVEQKRQEEINDRPRQLILAAQRRWRL